MSAVKLSLHAYMNELEEKNNLMSEYLDTHRNVYSVHSRNLAEYSSNLRIRIWEFLDDHILRVLQRWVHGRVGFVNQKYNL